MMKIFMIMIVFLIAAGSSYSETLQPTCDPNVRELAKHSGFYSLPHSRAARMFYFFFNSRARKTDPVVLWLAGGPGCGGETSALQENGPFHLSNMSLLPNPYSWDMVVNLLYVDQPTGTGFSLSPDGNDTRHDEESIAGDLYDFLQAFFKDRPQYTKNKIFIAGESYAGHYNPALASRIQRGNREQKGIHINLKGIAIGNGWTNPLVQYKTYADYALRMRLIGVADYDMIQKTLVPQCEELIHQCVSSGGEKCVDSDRVCENILELITDISGVSAFDIRKKPHSGGTNPLSVLEKFLNQMCVQEALGVGGQVPYNACRANAISKALSRDFFMNLDSGIPSLLEDGVEVLIYVGVDDLVCNWIGNERWLLGMKWSGADRFKNSPIRPFVVDGVKAGEVESYGPLAFMKVYNAGHNVPTNQPKASLKMLAEWISGNITKSKPT